MCCCEQAGQLEQQLNRWEAFFKYAAVLAPQITDGEAKAQREAPMVSDEDYANFEKWAVSQTTSDEMNKYGPFAKSLDLFKEALEDGGYTEAIADVKSLQKHLTQLIIVRTPSRLPISQALIPTHTCVAHKVWVCSMVSSTRPKLVGCRGGGGSVLTLLTGGVQDREGAAQKQA